MVPKGVPTRSLVSEDAPPASPKPKSDLGQERAGTSSAEPTLSSPLPEERADRPTHSAEGWRERALRLQAEMENVRRNQQRMAQEQARRDQERLLSDMLGVADNLERALAAAEQDSPLRRGVALTHDELLRVLANHGVQRVEAQGEPFDPHWHEAVGMVPAAGLEPGTVTEVMQSGYRLEERLLRPARVMVAR